MTAPDRAVGVPAVGHEIGRRAPPRHSAISAPARRVLEALKVLNDRDGRRRGRPTRGPAAISRR